MAVIAPVLGRRRTALRAKYPKRLRANDGWIGDPKHQASGSPENGGSDHNPNKRGRVDAEDDDTQGDCHVPTMLASSFLHGSTNYVIHRGRIWDADYRDFYPRTYTGANKHLDHQHTSIHQDPKAETSVEKWLFLETEPVWSKNIQQGAEGKEVRYTQAFLLAYGYALELDGVFGPGTDKVVRAFQAKYKLRVDGIVGPKTRKALRTTKGVL
jgi:hypothetical protein